MSGSEIMSEIEKQTNGHWRPSPGSIYPMLSWLQDKGYIKEAAEEAGLKRYTLTAQGRIFLEEHIKMREEMRKRFEHLGAGLGFKGLGPAFWERAASGFRPGPIGPMWLDFYPEKAGELQKATRDLAVAMWNLRDGLRLEYSEEVVEEAKKVLEEAAKSIEEIARKLQEKGRSQHKTR